MKFQGKLFMLILFMLASTTASLGQRDRDLSTGQGVLAGTQWRLVSMGRIGSVANLVAGSTVTMNFGNDGRVTGSGGCNSYGGNFRVQGDRITFSQIFSTKRACLSSDGNRQESQYFLALESTSRFRLSGSQLSIYYDNRGVLEFTSHGPGESPSPNVDSPVAALNAYYEAINSKNYDSAYRFWDRPTQSLDQFTRGFSDTASVRLLVDPSPEVEGAAGSSYSDVSVLLITRRTNGGERIYAGCYTMRKTNLRAEDGATRQGWLISRANVDPVSGGFGQSSISRQICRQ